MINVIENCMKPVYVNEMMLMCGQCELCKKMKAQEWVLRATHELISYKGKASFITLTYDNKNIVKANKEIFKPMNKYDKGGTLIKKDMVDFIKRIRKDGWEFRYIYCGEYGSNKWRPHYHMIVFGVNYDEWKREYLEKKWRKGFVDLDPRYVTENAISYVVGYIRKKILEKSLAKKVYTENDREPPYMRMSQGIGGKWAEKNKHKWVETLKIGSKGKQVSVPRYYIKKALEEEGRKIKYETRMKKEFYQNGKKINNSEIEYINRNNYKVFPNIENKNIQKLYKVQEKIKIIKDEKNLLKYKNMKDVHIEEIIRDDEIKRNKRINNKIDEWISIQDKSDNELSEELSKETRKKVYLDEEKEIKKYPPEKFISKEAYKKVNSMAWNRASEYIGSPYGKRNKYDE